MGIDHGDGPEVYVEYTDEANILDDIRIFINGLRREKYENRLRRSTGGARAMRKAVNKAIERASRNADKYAL